MKRRVAPHTLWQLNLTQGREFPPVLASLTLFYCSTSSQDHSSCFLFVHPRVCLLTYLVVARSLKELLIPMACMLATLANTIPHIITKQWHCSLLCFLPHSHTQLHWQMSSFYFQTYLKFVPCSSTPQPLSWFRFSSSLPWPTTTVSS